VVRDIHHAALSALRRSGIEPFASATHVVSFDAYHDGGYFDEPTGLYDYDWTAAYPFVEVILLSGDRLPVQSIRRWFRCPRRMMMAAASFWGRSPACLSADRMIVRQKNRTTRFKSSSNWRRNQC
jgi:hypothetical protein